ncbi:760a5753-8c15-4431-84ea-ecf2d402df03 [Sclerotinia trifoliorum]|uniref:760a5753-8c15-4431-84ea-ecf2d402df03 n=1 Tax=Sclerotinia trifoliorum TaxID=28548 RepID=A0A8H2W274_9HELO|nr:760a5753-8c15-4431-84ea-ecf2d402df03 [Sclerotinia trifoliorum]
MAQAIKDSFLNLEKYRQQLEDNIAKLQKSLQHWQTWDAEYDGLKEEILSADPTPNRDELISIARNYEADLVKGKEIEEILGTGTQRTAEQVVNLLDRRLDYVQQNINTIKKQIETAEEKLAKATIISTPDVRNEEGLPVTEIIEELDDEGNVISSRLSTPGDVKPQLLEVLHKAGIIEPASKDESLPAEEVGDDAQSKKASTHVDTISLPTETKTVNTRPKPFATSPKPVQKSVKFTNDSKTESVELKPAISPAAKRLEELMQSAKESEKISSEPAIIPADESPEDAALRRDMLQYGMSEVGSVVAEINLEDGSDWESEDYADDSDSDDDEDQFGKSTRPVVNDELHQRMIELEEKLGVRMMENVGKNSDDYGMVQEGIGRISISGKDTKDAGEGILTTSSKEKLEESNPIKSSTTDDSSKKSVRFAEELDISPAPEKPIASSSKAETKVAPVGDIIERKAPGQSSSAPPGQKKASRFKTSRASLSNSTKAVPNATSITTNSSHLKLFPATPATPKPFSQPISFAPAIENPRTVPTGPANRTLAPKIIEREVPLNTNAAAPDEFDPQLLHQEVATEYHRMRNRMIGKQGGFAREEESEIVPFTEEEGGPKKVSRFKAARLAKS